jgi:hypothetical protein
VSEEPEHRVTIRLATLGDAEAIAPLLGRLGYPTTADELAERIERLADLTVWSNRSRTRTISD